MREIRVKVDRIDLLTALRKALGAEKRKAENSVQTEDQRFRKYKRDVIRTLMSAVKDVRRYRTIREISNRVDTWRVMKIPSSPSPYSPKTKELEHAISLLELSSDKYIWLSESSHYYRLVLLGKEEQ